MRTFDTGATRDQSDAKFDYEGFLSPSALEAFGEYMWRHQIQSDGNKRSSDNWQKGMPIPEYLKSLIRHVFSIWRAHRHGEKMPLEEACAAWFNIQGIIHERLKEDMPKL